MHKKKFDEDQRVWAALNKLSIEDKNQEKPLVKGGQGRSSKNIIDSTTMLNWLLIVILTCTTIYAIYKLVFGY